MNFLYVGDVGVGRGVGREGVAVEVVSEHGGTMLNPLVSRTEAHGKWERACGEVIGGEGDGS